MAALPPIRRIFKEDLGSDVPEWITRLLAPLNLTLDALYRALNKNIEHVKNIADQERDFLIVAGAAAANNTFSFPVELATKPRGLTIVSVGREDGTVETFADAVFPSWHWQSSTNTVEITGITGLTNGVTYQIRVLVY